MKPLLISLLTLCFTFTQANDTIRLVHKNYITVFSKERRYPVLVEWWETKAKNDCKTPVARKDDFRPDPLLPEYTDLIDDYKHSGFDRGHMTPAASNLCMGKDIMLETFYFSNMTPQYHSLNAGDWKTLETMTRSLSLQMDSIHVWAGAIGSMKKIGRVSVPTMFWKVVYVKKSGDKRAYLFKHTNEKPVGLVKHAVKVEEIEKLTGFKF